MKKNRNIIFLLIKILLITIIIYITYKYICGFYIVKNSNYKSININPHDFLIYYKKEKEYQNNDIVFYNDNIYRIIGTNGQVIRKIGNKVMIDNDTIDEVNLNLTYPYTIKENELFLFNNMEDSRSFGCININDIKGKLVFRMQIRDF